MLFHILHCGETSVNGKNKQKNTGFNIEKEERGTSPEKLNDCIRIGSTGGILLIAALVIARTYTDYLFPWEKPTWYQGFLWMFGAVIAFQLIASILHYIYVVRFTGKLAVTATASFMHHIFRVPMEFFSQRMAGDLVQRAASNDTVASTLVGQIAPVMMTASAT